MIKITIKDTFPFCPAASTAFPDNCSLLTDYYPPSPGVLVSLSSHYQLFAHEIVLPIPDIPGF